jgi:hypothetical protein
LRRDASLQDLATKFRELNFRARLFRPIKL